MRIHVSHLAMSPPPPPPPPPPRQISFNPYDSTLVCATGETNCRLLRLAEQSFKPLPCALGKGAGGSTAEVAQGYRSHAWISAERLVLGTDGGELLLLEGGELKGPLACAPNDGLSVDSIIGFSRGFICGSYGGTVHIFEGAEGEPRSKEPHRARAARESPRAAVREPRWQKQYRTSEKHSKTRVFGSDQKH